MQEGQEFKNSVLDISKKKKKKTTKKTHPIYSPGAAAQFFSC